MAKQVYAIEGLDRIGKSTLIDSIRQLYGFYQVIHFSKPERLQVYQNAKVSQYPRPLIRYPEFLYQRESFINSMLIAQSGARVIFDRWHLGECVYSPLYRDYPGDYVFDIEKEMHLDTKGDIRLVLLAEDFGSAKHFVTDGGSFDDDKREQEQARFFDAFERSIIPDKRIVWVTNPATGSFRSKDEILAEVIGG